LNFHTSAQRNGLAATLASLAANASLVQAARASGGEAYALPYRNIRRRAAEAALYQQNVLAQIFWPQPIF
jgi:hypothetical protein